MNIMKHSLLIILKHSQKFIFGIFVLLLLSLSAKMCFAQGEKTEESTETSTIGESVTDPFNPLPKRRDDENNDAKQSSSDRVYLADGSVLEGNIIGYADKNLVLISSSLGKIKCLPKIIDRFSFNREKMFYIQKAPLENSEAIIVSVGSSGRLVYRESMARNSTPLDFEKLYKMSTKPIPTAAYFLNLSGISSLDYGNSEDFSFGVTSKLTAKTKNQNLLFNLEYTFSFSNDEVTRRLLTGSALYRFFWSDSFGFFGNVNARKDTISGIKFYNVLNAGLTYRTSQSIELEFNIDLGIGYIYESLTSSTTDYFGAFLSFTYNHYYNENWELNTTVSFNGDMETFEKWFIVANAELHFILSTEFSIGLRVEDTYKAKPAEGFKNNDIRLVLTVSINYRSMD